MKNKGLSIRKKSKLNNTNMHRYTVPQLVEKLINQADIILEVLDSRFIDKTRNTAVEETAKKLNKKIIYILNKSDLGDIREIKSNVELHELKPYVFISCKTRTGKSDLKDVILKEAVKINKDAVNLGIVGYPNTGKSSLINILCSKSAAKTSSQAGFTKGLQKVKLSDGLYLIDTPGIIPLNEKERLTPYNITKHAEISAKSWDKTKEPEMVVHRLIEANPTTLESHYRINAKGNSEYLIEVLGEKLGYLKKGGVVDTDRTARKILRDWQEGKIRIKQKS